MNLYRTARAVASSSGDRAIDWRAAAEGAKGVTPPGSLVFEPGEREGYATDVRDARDEIGAVAGVTVVLPDQLEIQHRHHWIDANVETFQRVMAPMEEYAPRFPGIARTVNTGTMTVMLAFLGRNVLGQYDPLLLAEDPSKQHALYFVRPNIRRIARLLDLEYDRFRRWIAFHEVTHAAEFAMAPWLSGHLEDALEEGVAALAGGSFDRQAFRELDATMTVVEGYAELLMDHAFDREYADLRRTLEAHRRGRNPVEKLIRRLLGLGLKRRQYERGRAFFDHVVEARDLETAAVVWDGPANLPDQAELDDPARWLRRVDP